MWQTLGPGLITGAADEDPSGIATYALIPVPAWLAVLLFGGVCAAGQVFLKHTRYVSVLKWLTLSLLAYFGTLATVRIPWGDLLAGLI